VARGKESSAVDGMPIRRQRTRTGGINFLTGHELSSGRAPVGRTASTTLERGTTQRLFLWMKLGWGAVEIAFDHEDGDIVAEAKVFRKIRRAAEDVFHERFRG